MRHSLGIALFTLTLCAQPVLAQGTLSTQGFGYPPGQLSTRAATMGGGLAETDPLSPLNPAALADWVRSGLYLQYSPEFRSVEAADATDHTMTVRFPVIAGALTLGRRAVVGLSASTLLDRTWETHRIGYVSAGSDSTQFAENFKSAGAINDLRLGVSYGIQSSLWVGVGAHVFSGDNLLDIRRFSDDTTVAPFAEQSRLSYSGTGLSGGIAWRPLSALTVGVSGRVGGTIKSFRNDSSLTHATVPERLGAGVTFSGISGVLIAARVDWQGWSSLNDLGRSGLGVTDTTDVGAGGDRAEALGVTDTWDVGAGVEVNGPSFFGSAIPIRAGFRRRTLPFTLGDAEVRETSLSIGAGIPISGGSSRIDLGLERANRGSVGGVSERAWIFSAGFMVRP